MSTHTVVGFFLSAFLLEVAGVQPYVVSLCTFLGRAWDALTDPTVGHFVARTNTRFGTLRPWIMVGLGPCLAAYFFIWRVPDFDEPSRAAYYILLYLAFSMFFSMYQVPYTSLTMHISPEPKERDEATTFRMLVEGIAVLMGSVGQSFIIGELTAGKTESRCNCSDPSAAERPFEVNHDVVNAYTISAGAIVGLALICGLFLLAFVPEDRRMTALAQKHKHSFVSNFLMLVRNRSYMTLTGMFLWAWMCNNVNQSNFILWLKYGFNRQAEFQFFILTLLVTTLVVTPLWFYLMRVLGKPRAFMLGLLIQIPWAVSQLFLGESTSSLAIHFGTASGALGLGAVYLLPWAMLPDVIDEHELKTGKRNDPAFYSFFVFFQKFGSGIAIALCTLVLQYAGGYQANKCCVVQPPSVRTALQYLVSLVPAGLLTISLIFSCFYRLTPARCQEIKKQLAERRDRLEMELQKEREAQATSLPTGRETSTFNESSA